MLVRSGEGNNTTCRNTVNTYICMYYTHLLYTITTVQLTGKLIIYCTQAGLINKVISHVLLCKALCPMLMGIVLAHRVLQDELFYNEASSKTLYMQAHSNSVTLKRVHRVDSMYTSESNHSRQHTRCMHRPILSLQAEMVELGAFICPGTEHAGHFSTETEF